MTTPAAWYPEAIKRPIPPGDGDPRITPALAILHVAASNGPSLFGWFNGPSKGIESHFYIRKDGTVEQYRSVLREADANYKANSYVIGSHRFGAVSIETEGRGGGRWTAKQLLAIKHLILWLHREHGIRLHAVAAARPGMATGGVSYHTRFLVWSNVAGKTCPGPRRIKQYNTVILPWLRATRECTHCPVHCPKEV